MILGTPFGAGSQEDGPGPSIFSERLWNNPFSATRASWRYRSDRYEAAVQAPRYLFRGAWIIQDEQVSASRSSA